MVLGKKVFGNMVFGRVKIAFGKRELGN